MMHILRNNFFLLKLSPYYVLDVSAIFAAAEENTSIPILTQIDTALLNIFKERTKYFAENKASMSAWKDLYQKKEFQNGLK